MNLPERLTQILESREAKAIAVIIGIASGLLALLAPASPKLVRPVAAGFLGIVALYFLWVVAKLAAAREPALPEAEVAHRYLSESYGWSYDTIELEVTVRKDGSAKVRRVGRVEAYSMLDSIDTFLLIPEEAPGDEKRGIEIVGVESMSPDRDISWRFVRGARTLGAELTIVPRLNCGETFTYAMEENLFGLYAIDLSAGELAKRETPWDYFGWTIKRPTRHLSIKVYFPEEIKPSVYDNEVRYASATIDILDENRVFFEAQRALERPSLTGPKGGQYCLQQNVEYPTIGLIYALRWDPLQTR